MSLPIFIFFFFPLITMIGGQGVDIDDCKPTRCKKHGPLVQFPFRLKNLQPHHCGYHNPAFDLFCENTSKETVLELPSSSSLSIKLSVKKINYVSQRIHLFNNLETCFPQKLPYLNLYVSPFKFHDKLDDLELLNCSMSSEVGYTSIPCLSSAPSGFQVFAVSADSIVSNYDYSFTSCTKIHEILSVPPYILDRKDIYLNWLEPACGLCEARGKLCSSLSSKDSIHQIQCIDKVKNNNGKLGRTPLIAGATIGPFLFVATLAALFYIYISIRRDRENQAKIEKFLEDYKALKPTRFSYADLKRITNQFTEKLGEGGYGTVYKGKLSNDIYVAVKVLNNTKGNGEEFINEVGTIGRIHHVNVVRLVGFCAEEFRRALVYEFLPNDSLEKFIFQTGHRIKKHSLGWEKLQDIALGIAKGIEYLHQGCDQQIVHFDIKPHNILLEYNFNPKICDFGLAKLCAKEQSTVSMTAVRGTMGYIAPEVLSRTFGRVSYKSDVYSFGMLLLEMVGGRKNIDDTVTNSSQVYFPQWIYNNLLHNNNEGEEMLEVVGIEEGDECNSKIVRKLIVVGLWCIQWYPADRPSMKAVIQMLEGDGENLTMPPNPFPSTNIINSVAAGGIPRRHHQIELEIISESE